MTPVGTVAPRAGTVTELASCYAKAPDGVRAENSPAARRCW